MTGLHPLSGAIVAFARLLCGASVTWVGCRPDAGPRVYIANHTSHLDFVVIWAALPPEIRALTRPVAAADYWSNGLRRYLARNVFHAHLVERRMQAAGQRDADVVAHARAAVEATAAAMSDRHSLILFPEGTRGTGEAIATFKSGLYHLCLLKPGLRVQPVFIDNMSRVLPKGEVAPVPLLARVLFGPSISLLPDEPKDAFLTRARQAIEALRDA